MCHSDLTRVVAEIWVLSVGWSREGSGRSKAFCFASKTVPEGIRFISTKKKTRTEFLDKHGVKHRYYQSYFYVYGIYGSESLGLSNLNIKSYIILDIFVLYHIKFWSILLERWKYLSPTWSYQNIRISRKVEVPAAAVPDVKICAIFVGYMMWMIKSSESK